MAIWIGNRDEPRSVSSKVYRWLKWLLVLGFLSWIPFALRNYSEDKNSHAIRVSFPLLLGYDKIVYRPAEYDSAKAVWGPVQEAIGVADGQIIFVRVHQAIYAVKFIKQTLTPEQAEYEYLEVGHSSTGAISTAATSFPGGIRLPGTTVPWSGHVLGKGFIYLKNPFLPGRKSRFELGVPFYNGNLENYSKVVPADVHFESLPYKVGEAPDGFD